MPGAYAHITLVNVLSKTGVLERELALPKEACKSLMKYSKFCDLGAISPDYPYLKLGPGSKKASRWSDLMHNRFDKPTLEKPTVNVLHNGVRSLRKLDGSSKMKCFAWFSGYAAHIGADVTVHPVVNLKVGNYDEGNQTNHRVCEMHQDAYIYSSRMKLKIGVSEHIEEIIGTCTKKDSEREIDDDINWFWTYLLESSFPKEYGKNPPSINDWHKAVHLYLGDIAEEGNKLFPFARHVGARIGITYPNYDEVDKPKYINSLSTPVGVNMSYDEIFDKAARNIGEMWNVIADGVFGNGRKYLTRLGIWNLDSGKDENDDMVLWR